MVSRVHRDSDRHKNPWLTRLQRMARRTFGLQGLVPPRSELLSPFSRSLSASTGRAGEHPDRPRRCFPVGIFVIETKNYKGWIFGSENQRQWTQQIYRQKNRFQNPLHQNYLHVQALMAYLGLPENRFRPVVFFIGEAEFKTEMPPNVLNRGLISWIESHDAVFLPPSLVENILLNLCALVDSTDKKAASRAHIAAIRERN